jgi:hypothetical protein
MGLLDLVHAILDYVMTWVHLVRPTAESQKAEHMLIKLVKAQNGQVGWKSFNRKVNGNTNFLHNVFPTHCRRRPEETSASKYRP